MIIAALLAGTIFGFGLALSTMIQPSVVLSFLNFTDLGLLLVLGGAVSITTLAYQVFPRVLKKPLVGKNTVFQKHEAVMDRSTVIGAAIFGVGWGICGVCPGPSIAGLGAGSWELGFAIAGIAIGAWVHGVTSQAR